MRPDSSLIELEDRDEKGYKYQFYSDKSDPQRRPRFWRRKDYPDVVYRSEEAKLRAIAHEILRYHVIGRPVLVGTTSVELSERISGRLRAAPIRRLAMVKVLRHAWMEHYKREEDGRAIPELEFLNGPLDQLQNTDLRKLARDLDLPFNPESPDNLDRLLFILELGEGDRGRLSGALQAGIPHPVLNARKHTSATTDLVHALYNNGSYSASAGTFEIHLVNDDDAGAGVAVAGGADDELMMVLVFGRYTTI